MNPQPVPSLMTVAEVADVMRVSKMTVYRLIHSGELPAIRVGKSFRVPQSALETLLDVSWPAEKDLKSGS